MNGPFSRSYFHQQPSRSARTVPVHQTQPQKQSSKVVSVPVHFVSADQPKTTSLMLKDSSALKIQKTFRGFLVRKIVKKIVSIRNEVIEIERKINNDTEFFNLIRTDPKERLRVNETLMSLLFKLDSVHGVDFAVRVLRKSVTNKAIALQEKVDSIGQQTLDSPNHINDSIDHACTTEEVTENNISSSIDEVDDEIVKEVDENWVSDVKIKEEEEEEEDEGLIGEMEKRGEVKKLMDDNEKMMELMKKISETNEMQTRMINSLSGRVEQLEKAFMISRIMRLNKKKKRTHCCDLQK
ncbi:uncharacterized protein [Rutidosis leptorrhynchoides]|uniref:uncharacterized protein n=1 Tax=Rutidosis leptorrhynchoides TaxID=125765 RepID=UPI003A992AEF